MVASENRNGPRELLRNQERQAHQDRLIDGGRSLDHKPAMQAHQRTGSAGSISEAPSQTLFGSAFGMGKEYRALAPVYTGARVGTPLKRDLLD